MSGSEARATYRVLYWQEIPAQIRARDLHDEVTLPLADRFQARIDREAMKRGLEGTDEYLKGWHWSDPRTRPGTAHEMAEAVKPELEAAFPAKEKD